MWAAAEFRRAGVDAPRLAAEVLLAHVLGWERSRAIAHHPDALDEARWEEFRIAVRRHAAGEPLQYVTGEREFWGLSFRVTPAVLIPRPETEILVEKALELARTRGGGVRFADVGTGSGCIAVSVAHELAAARGLATDISPAALEVAQENARRAGVGARIAFICCDLLSCFPARPYFDMILSNPPYIPDGDMAGLSGIVREHEPYLALSGGDSGIEAYRRLIPQAAARLQPGGWLLLEIGAGQADAVGALLRKQDWLSGETMRDLQGIPRCLVARRAKF
jgi:release factor glutamine methyltransferase